MVFPMLRVTNNKHSAMLGHSFTTQTAPGLPKLSNVLQVTYVGENAVYNYLNLVSHINTKCFFGAVFTSTNLKELVTTEG